MIALLFASAAMATAQFIPPIPNRFPDRSSPDPVTLGQWYADARCLVKRQGVLAEKVLATRPESFDFMRAFMAADTPAQCFVQQSTSAQRLHSNATRGAIAEALLLRDFSAVGKPRGSHVAPVVSLSGPRQQAATPTVAHAEAMLSLAECAVRVDPNGSFAVFSTGVASPAEDGAVRALVPAIGQCLPPGFEFTLQPPVLRSYLAEAAYRVSAEAMRGAAR